MNQITIPPPLTTKTADQLRAENEKLRRMAEAVERMLAEVEKMLNGVQSHEQKDRK